VWINRFVYEIRVAGAFRVRSGRIFVFRGRFSSHYERLSGDLSVSSRTFTKWRCSNRKSSLANKNTAESRNADPSATLLDSVLSHNQENSRAPEQATADSEEAFRTPSEADQPPPGIASPQAVLFLECRNVELVENRSPDLCGHS
jgi:hypothetical protein